MIPKDGSKIVDFMKNDSDLMKLGILIAWDQSVFFYNFGLISSARSVYPSCIFVIIAVYAFVNVRATIVMIRIEVFGLEYVYSVILYFAIASPNSKWPSCSLSAKSQVARFKNFTFRDGKIISKGTGLAPLKILLISRNWQRI